MALSSAPETGPIQAAIVRHGTVIAQAQIRPIVGNVQFKLGRQTPAINRARLCITNLGKQRAVFLGEHKKTRRHPGASMRRPVPSVVFLKRGTSSWLGRAGTIITRFGYQQAGIFGEWALWVAALLALGMFVLALWAAVSQREPGSSPGPTPRPRGGIRTQLTRIPTPGWICALVALLSALTWSLIVPLFQVPDEQAHVGYAQHVAEVGAPPAGDTDASALSQDERRLLARLRWRAVTHRPENLALTTPRCASQARTRGGAARRPGGRGRIEQRHPEPAALLRDRGGRLPAITLHHAAGPGARDATRLRPARRAHGAARVPLPARGLPGGPLGVDDRRPDGRRSAALRIRRRRRQQRQPAVRGVGRGCALPGDRLSTRPDRSAGDRPRCLHGGRTAHQGDDDRPPPRDRAGGPADGAQGRAGRSAGTPGEEPLRRLA